MRENTPPHKSNLHELVIDEDPNEDVEGFFIDEDEIFDDIGGDLENDEEEEFEEAILDGAGNLQFSNNIPEIDVSIVSFSKHDAPVFCCHLHPNKDLAITGGEDDRAYIWNTKTGDVLHKIERSDSVTHACFNHDGLYIAVGDISGEIEVYKLDDKLTKVWEYSMGDMGWLKWHFSSNVLIAGSDAGEVYVWRIPAGDCKILPSQGSKCETGQLSKDGKKLLTGYVDGTVKLWDIKNVSAIMEVSPTNNTMALTSNVVTVSCSNEYDLYMAGAEDSNIIFMNSNGPLQVIETGSPIECVAFCQSPELKVCASGSLSGEIIIWDYIRYASRVTCDHPDEHDGISVLQWLPEQTLLVGTITGNLIIYDGRSGVKKCALPGHSADIYNVCYSEREKILLTASEDHTAKIFNYAP